MSVLPKALEELIEAFGKLPGVGPRTAERYANYLLKSGPEKSKILAERLSKLHTEIGVCPITFALIEKTEKVSRLYSDVNRDKTTVAVVAEPFDIIALEKTGSFKGTYHVLGGLISPIDGVNPEQLHIKELESRLKNDNVKEVILALNANVEGESTALYIQQQIDAPSIKFTRLARGIPVGIDLEYADQITLGKALEGRTILE